MALAILVAIGLFGMGLLTMTMAAPERLNPPPAAIPVVVEPPQMKIPAVK